MKAPPLSSSAHPLIALELDSAAFTANWKHCDQVANYVARSASYDRTDPFLYANLLSTVLNELLEVAFLRLGPQAQLNCTLLRDGSFDRIELDLPVGEAESGFYRLAVAQAQSKDVDELYRNTLLTESEPDRSVALLELAATYGAKVWLNETRPGRLQLVIDLDLENPCP